MSKKTAVILAGFGGPETPAQVRPFIESVSRGAHIPLERLEAVAHHYEKIGGASKYNEITFKQRDALERLFKKKGLLLEVFAGFMHSHPPFKKIFLNLQKKGVQRALIFVLSTFRSYPTFKRYRERLDEARKTASAQNIDLEYSGPFHDNPLFIEAVSQRVSDLIKKIPSDERSKTHFIFTAHSIPIDWAEKSDYADEFETSASLVAKKLGLGSWDVAYQSRSGPPKYPWLEPDVNEAIRDLPRGKYTRAALVPIGFLCDNAEVLYDLDIETRKTAEECGLRYARASTVNDHPAFIEMIASLIKQRAG